MHRHRAAPHVAKPSAANLWFSCACRPAVHLHPNLPLVSADVTCQCQSSKSSTTASMTRLYQTPSRGKTSLTEELSNGCAFGRPSSLSLVTSIPGCIVCNRKVARRANAQNCESRFMSVLIPQERRDCQFPASILPCSQKGEAPRAFSLFWPMVATKPQLRPKCSRATWPLPSRTTDKHQAQAR